MLRSKGNGIKAWREQPTRMVMFHARRQLEPLLADRGEEAP